MKKLNHDLSVNMELAASIESLKNWLGAQADGETALQAMLLVGAGMLLNTPNQTASITFLDSVVKLSMEKRGMLQ